MQENVMISIRGDQEFAETGKDTTEFLTEGTLATTDYGYLLEYDESALTGMEGTHTAFQIHPASITLIRTGVFRSEMIFELDKKHYSLYDTPYGAMTLDISTSALHNTIDENGGTLEVTYAIEIEHQLIGENKICIQVRPSDSAHN